MTPLIIQDVKEEREFSRLFSDVAKGFDFGEEKVKEAALSIKEELQRQPWHIRNACSGIDFDDVLKCCGYALRYAACHCALVRYTTQVLFSEMSHFEFDSLISRGTLKVASVGGGPGNDLMGFCSAVAKSGYRFHRLELTLVDLKKEWKDVFLKAFTLASERYYGDVTNLFRGLDVKTKFVAADLTAQASSSCINSADIILMTKVLSIVPNEQKDQIIQGIFASMKNGAIFLYTDIDSHVVLRNACNMAVLCCSERRSFMYNRADTASIAQSSYEICALQKIDSSPWRTRGVQARRMNDMVCYEDCYSPYYEYSSFATSHYGHPYQEF